MMNRNFWKVISELSFLLIIFTALLILLGACIRLTHSGLSCPDWPLCYGLWLPTYSKIHLLPEIHYGFSQVFFEWSHRFLAGTLIGGLLFSILCYSLFSFLRFQQFSFSLFAFLIILVLLILVQILLGSFTVFSQNESWTVALHQIAALLFYFFLWGLFTSSHFHFSVSSSFSLKVFGFFSFFLLLITMASGAIMAKTGASLMCTTWPLCQEFNLETLKDPLFQLHLSHRLLSLISLLFHLFLFWKIRHHPFFYYVKWLLLILFGQILYGGFLIFSAVPFGASVFHILFSLICISISSSLFWKLVLPKKKDEMPN
uniref:Cytochrome c oxidase subunit 15 n=1 Tax=Andalucia godoyi TaxID=505711 RepID=M4Q9F7_ANDGO|nr:cytochrome c oxidase subunit 15 [Andalucia godoyi]AGH23996.1 cytochrome c oxidase subunit 15 [Andalucia godoyi]